jgi:DNA-binding NarL/FixJ family response regulator
MKPLRILIADDHQVVRAGIRALLEDQPDCEICGEAVTGAEVVALVRQLKPDIAILDITMPELNGLEAARQILEAVPDVRVLILSVHESEGLVRQILDTGAHGYVLKSDAGRELTAAIDALRKHETYFTSRVAQIALRAYRDKKPIGDATPPVNPLTPRESEVLQLLAEGRINKEVASALGISVLTVDTHRANIMHKLGAHSVTELVHYAVRHKIITP